MSWLWGHLGRPTKLDDLTAKRIVDAVAKGLPRDTAARLGRVTPRTLYDWLARGRAGEQPYLQFLQRVEEAEAEGEQELVVHIRTAASRNWQAAAWLLNCRRPDAYVPARERAAPVEEDTADTSAEDISVARSVVAALESRKAS